MSRRSGGRALLLPAALLLAGCSAQSAPPAGSAGDQLFLTESETVRFLNRATFGASPAATARLQELGPARWIDEQMARPATLFLPAMRARIACAPEITGDLNCPPEYDFAPAVALRHELFWNAAVGAPDQLRQRVAFALSQILVVSERHEELSETPFGLAGYHDELLRGAFGDFRTLIEAVSKDAAMGEYLGMVQNRKADPVTNTRPDENFARELMQLFTIGLSMLGPDGTVLLDAGGQPIPTYTQADIEETARALTGWNYASDDGPGSDLFAFLDVDRRAGPMQVWPAFHDDGPKVIVGGVPLPGGLGAEGDLDAVLDTLCNHPNVGPFIGKQLIQRLVTSNPSPAYVARVSAVWADDGSGRRGNLGAVVRAILLDQEALDGTAGAPEFGIVREPVLRLSSFFRAFEAGPVEQGTEMAQIFSEELRQGPLTAPSVFNFYRPTDTNQSLASQGLVAPELKVTTHSALTGQANLMTFMVYDAMDAVPEPDWQGPRYTAGPLLSAAETPESLVSLVEKRLLADPFPAPVRDQILDHLNSVPIEGNGFPRGYERATELLILALHSPAYNVQK